MFRGLRGYEEYADAGRSEIGPIPKGWKTRRFRYLLAEDDRRSTSGGEQLLRVSQYTGVTERRSGGEVPDTRARSLIGYKVVSQGQLVVNIMLAWNGSLGVSQYDGIVSPAYCVYSVDRDLIPAYLHHLLRTPMYKGLIRAESTGVVESRLRLYTDDLNRLAGIVPPIEEQRAIVTYLAHAHQRINKAIAAKRRLIELLEESERAALREVFGRGCSEGLRQAPRLSWIGQIPVQWPIVALRYLATIGNGSTPARSSSSYWTDGDFPWLNSSVVNQGVVRDSDQFVTSAALEKCHLPIVPPRSILVGITGQGRTRGMAALLEIEATISQHLAYLTVDHEQLNPDYLLLVFKAAYGELRLLSSDAGSTKAALTVADLKSFRIPVPPLGEQSRIVSEFECQVAVTRMLSDRTTREIALLEEFKTRLTSDVVTGQLDVREIAATLPPLDLAEAFAPAPGTVEEEGADPDGIDADLQEDE